MNAQTNALALFDHVADMGRLRRHWFMTRLARRDPSAHAALKALLAADARDDDVQADVQTLVTSAAQRSGVHCDVADALPPGTRLGPWRIDGVLGVGGMSVVHAAHRDDGEYEQQIAIKSIRDPASARRLGTALRSERDILARLDHPDIVSILDAGVDAHGRPWFAMGRIDGMPIDQWCDRKHLSLRERIALFADICAAVQYAHDKGVIHCDIKPGNVLVRGDGRPRLLDFGMSSLLRVSGSPNGDPPQAFSSGYSAPEWLHGREATRETDVYSLGVLLYRLVCGDWPHRALLATLLFDTGQEREDAPSRPSDLARTIDEGGARARGCATPARLARMLRGDLDAICMACVRSRPEDRYRTAADLRRDLQAWLRKRPVTVNAGLARRCALFIRRNAVAVTLTTGLVAASASVAGYAYLQAKHAQDDLEANQVVLGLFGDTLDAATITGIGTPRLNTPRTLDEIERQLDRFPTHDNWRIRANGLAALARSHAAIADYDTAKRLAMEARDLGRDDPLQRARVAGVLASLHNLESEFSAAQAEAESGLAALQENRSRLADSLRLSLGIAIAEARWGQADHQGAMARVASELSKVDANAPDAPTRQATLLILRGQWRGLLFQNDAAEADLRRAIALTAVRDPGTADTARIALSLLLRTKSDSAAKTEAVALARAVLDRRIHQYGPEHPETGRAWIALARGQVNTREWQPAHESLAKGSAILRRTLGDESPELIAPLILSAIFSANGEGTPADTERLHREALRIAIRAYGPAHRETYYARATLAVFLCDSVRHGRDVDGRMQAEALRLLETNIEARRHQGLPAPFEWTHYTKALMLAGDIPRAEAALQQAIPEVERYYGRKQGFWLALKNYQAELLYRKRDYASADAVALEAAKEAESQLPAFIAHGMLVEILQLRVKIAAAQGDRARESTLRTALARAERAAERNLQ